MQEVKISVILPIYNVEEYLKECLDSVVAQTFRDIEIICVNDCSPDNSSYVLQDYAAKEQRIKIINHTQNKGASAARNTGMDVASGKYIFFLDPDDVLARNDVFELLYAVAEEDNADQVIGRALRWYPEDNSFGGELEENYGDQEIRRATLLSAVKLHNNVVAWNKLIKTSMLKQYKIQFDETLKKFEDNDFSCRVHILSKCISYVPIYSLLYRQRTTGNTSIMHTKNRNDYINCYKYGINILNAVSKYNQQIYLNIFIIKISLSLERSYKFLQSMEPTEQEKIHLMQLFESALVPLHKKVKIMLPPKIQAMLPYLGTQSYLEAWDAYSNTILVARKKIIIALVTMPDRIRCILTNDPILRIRWYKKESRWPGRYNDFKKLGLTGYIKKRLNKI